jgi:hypothetical protein
MGYKFLKNLPSSLTLVPLIIQLGKICKNNFTERWSNFIALTCRDSLLVISKNGISGVSIGTDIDVILSFRVIIIYSDREDTAAPPPTLPATMPAMTVAGPKAELDRDLLRESGVGGPGELSPW